MGYIVGLDYGTKYCGLSKAEANAPVKVATPWCLLKTGELEDFLQENIEQIDLLVIGESRNLSGGFNAVAEEARALALKMQARGLPIVFEDERFSTQASLAEERMLRRKTKTRKKQHKERKDAQAATLILQSYLNKL